MAEILERNSEGEPTRLRLRQPFDGHLHVRDGEAMASVLPYSARGFDRAIIMPNLTPPVTTVALAEAYRERMLNVLVPKMLLPNDALNFLRMTLYLTDKTTPDEIERAVAAGFISGVKYYPAGATTNSEAGVTDIRGREAVIAKMEEFGLPLLVHGEVADGSIDIFKREEVFIEREFPWLVGAFTRLRLTVEHATTAETVHAIRDARDGVAATITPQHLLYWRNDLLDGEYLFQGRRKRGLCPHLYCKPILKGARDRAALLEAATSGNPKFFLGTDSAPHPIGDKEASCCSAGAFSAPIALSLYARAFEKAGALERLEGFASLFGPNFYGLPPSETVIELIREPFQVPSEYNFGQTKVVPLCAGETLEWRADLPEY